MSADAIGALSHVLGPLAYAFVRALAGARRHGLRRGFAPLIALFLLLPLSATSAEPPVQNAPAKTPTRKGSLGKKAAWTAQILRQDPSGFIEGLEFTRNPCPVTLMPQGDKLRPLAQIRGRFNRPGWVLEVPAGRIAGDSARDFVIYVYLGSRTSALTLTATGPDGEEESERIVLFAPNAQEFRIGAPWGELLASVGLTAYHYGQTGYRRFESKTGMLSLAYRTPDWGSRFGAIADVRATLLTLSSDPSQYGPQLIEGKLDATWLTTANRGKRLQPSLLLGLSYLTMLNNGSPFGFANLIAPEGGVRATYTLNPAWSMVGDFRYVPVDGIFMVLQSGINLNLGLSRKLPNLHRIETSISLSNYFYKPDGITEVKSQLWSLRIGYSI